MDDDRPAFYLKPGYRYPAEPPEGGWHYVGVDYAVDTDYTTIRLECPHGNAVTITGLGTWHSIRATFPDGCPLDMQPQYRPPPPEDGIALG